MEKVIEIDSDGNEFEVTKKEAEEIWMRVYNIARTYRKNHFSLNVSKNFVTYTGEEYNPNGYNLGRWIEHQRTLKKEGKLSQDKIDLLDDIDMIWEEVKIDYIKPFKLRYCFIICFQFPSKSLAVASWPDCADERRELT